MPDHATRPIAARRRIPKGYIYCDCHHRLCPGYKWPKGKAELAERDEADQPQ